MAKKSKKTEEKEANAKLVEFGSAITQIADEKGIDKGKIIETVEAALAAAYKKDYGKRSQNIRAQFDEISGRTKFFLVKEVVDETTREFVVEEEGKEADEKAKTKKNAGKFEKSSVSAESSDEEKLPRFNPERDIILSDAKKAKKDAKLGDFIENELESKEDYGRIAAQTAKQVIIQRIREAEREAMFKEYKEKEGEIISGTVQRVEGRNVFIDMGKSTGVLFPSEQIEGENYRIGQRIKVYIVKVESDTKGPGILLSRTHPEMVRRIFELEVPEIFAGTVEINAIAREAGGRTKIAVSSKEEGIDPIGSCVGQKGTRVQAVIEELSGEKIDIILWNKDPKKFISAAMSPAKVLSIEINEETKQAKVIVPEDQLSLAIGKRGQNVRLAAKLTDWKIDVEGGKNKEEVAPEGDEQKVENSEQEAVNDEK
ncbi:MAG: NusA antitermination factor [Candidatus Moranbacteria bacterium GW2011_GWE2_35_2-]|nr:MAG: NusA antitermination factor [Candidatus Moranbacteria bacterium GW2011_GWE2_35_2-]KKQ22185.1 MAG: NusA antitermination factor [Candidatus Moranbacteria bacterium GW2011_GWF2_37_11]KKQ28759.1 MAG: NusA antitermination factor [Candidatus Moranbacteria bacterium GW2011_GWD1_37_17]KKQ30323.1 MAG: NusA antitermination factor [Candidatus Moranbacteria bacterium GW2011_GWE1_37_24]KKQ47351.1 MAG: NusA antitermination factor [Candidatus Moranbacteria bacterium GW2011_GWD2_37_9]HBO16647.1 transc